MSNFKKSQLVKVDHHGAIPYVGYVDADNWLSGIIIDILEEGLWYGAGIDVYVISLQKIFRYYPEYVRLLKKDV